MRWHVTLCDLIQQVCSLRGSLTGDETTFILHHPSVSGAHSVMCECLQKDRNITIIVRLHGFPDRPSSLHGFHVHAIGNLSDNCNGAKGHYNPANMTHGAPDDIIR